MLFWTLKTTIFSIIFILLVHHLITFFKETLTVPKVKDLVNAPAKKYEDMYQVINSNKREKEHTSEKVVDNYEKPDLDAMKSELKNFLKSRAQTEGTTDISTLDTGYSNYASY